MRNFIKRLTLASNLNKDVMIFLADRNRVIILESEAGCGQINTSKATMTL
jgi:hypothetical protein